MGTCPPAPKTKKARGVKGPPRSVDEPAAERGPGTWEETNEHPPFDEHPKRYFILKALLMIGLIPLRKPLVRLYMGLIALFFLLFFVWIRLQALAEDRDPRELFNQHLTVTPYILPERDRRFGAWTGI